MRSARIIEGLPCADIVFCGHPMMFLENLKRPIDYLLLSPAGGIEQVAELMSSNCREFVSVDVGPVWGKHEVEYKMDLVRKMGYRGPTPSTQVVIFPINHDKVDSFLKLHNIDKFIAINAAYLKDEHWSLKHWGNNNYSQLLQQLINLFPNFFFLFVGNEDDNKDAEEIINNTNNHNRCLNMCGWSDV